jgi:uncharacterized membrane protein YhaH (DUF805 family)
MGLSGAVRDALSRFADFNGRTSRAGYWWWVLFILLVQLATGIVDAVLVAPLLGFAAFDTDAGQPLGFVAALALLVPSLAAAARRLHDIGRTGWWILAPIIPILGALVLLWFLVQRGDEGPNRFGPPRR